MIFGYKQNVSVINKYILSHLATHTGAWPTAVVHTVLVFGWIKGPRQCLFNTHSSRVKWVERGLK